MIATVYKSTGSWYLVRTETGDMVQARVVGKLRLDDLKTTNPIAVGDEVEIVMDDADTASIQAVIPRRNYVLRQSPRKKHNVHLLAANVDQALLIVTMVEPNLKPGFVDRFLMMTEPYNIPVILAFNKCDIYGQEENDLFEYYKAVYENIGYTVIKCSAVDGTSIEDLSKLLKDHTTLIAGQSGVGKSSLVNAIQSGLELRTTEISEYSGNGQHTTTFAEMYDLEMGGRIIDTPGIKTLAFNHFEVMDVAHNFREIFSLSKDCRFADCTHRNEPNCAVKAAVEAGWISEQRYNTYLQLLAEVEDQNYWERHSDV
ncbi:MAG: ribosome small subunit-dependent GTPase A [Saprospiraceae bacterium]|nr:ribosome small subunit-dependent GTPase A [Saprospiraceae bacterium]